ncbi:MAG: preprotein translocase subunit YajC [Nocardioidaceae bacterium]
MKSLGAFLPFVLLAVVFWLLVVRPQRNRQRKLSLVQHELTPGAEVMLGSGIYGTVVSVEDDRVHLEVAPGTTITVARAAVVRVDSEPPGTDSAFPDVAPEEGPTR